MLSDKEIIRLCIQGDEKAFRILVDRYSGYLFSVAFRILNQEQEARDVVQEVFLSIWCRIESIRLEQNFRNWLYRILVNRCYDIVRKKKKRRLQYADFTDWNIPGVFSDDTPDRNLNNEEIGLMIKDLTNNLSPKQKIVFVLGELEELSHDDIAGITGMTKTAVKSNLYHARKNIGTMIRKYMKE